MDAEILRCAQDDSQDTTQVLSRQVLSPNVWYKITLANKSHLIRVSDHCILYGTRMELLSHPLSVSSVSSSLLISTLQKWPETLMVGYVL
jgi:hypothetical protein